MHIRNLTALCKAFLIDTKENKLAFILGLFLPTIVFLINNMPYLGKAIPHRALIAGLATYLAYIIVTSSWNLVALPLMEMRERGALKQLSYITNNVTDIMLSHAVVQMTAMIIETTLFTTLALSLTVTMDFTALFMTVIGTCILGIPIIVLCLAALKSRARLQTMNLGITLFIIAMLTLNTVKTTQQLTSLFLMLNPFRFLSVGLETIGHIIDGSPVDATGAGELMAVYACYLLIGLVVIPTVKTRPVLNRA
jgi:hypothetical protein